jgi:hypothetical protein
MKTYVWPDIKADSVKIRQMQLSIDGLADEKTVVAVSPDRRPRPIGVYRRIDMLLVIRYWASRWRGYSVTWDGWEQAGDQRSTAWTGFSFENSLS